MGLPKITAGDLIALRDGSEVAVGIDIALRGDVNAQLALLESRLLALALSMPRGKGAADLPPAPTDRTPLRTATLAAYLSGTLADEALAEFEASIKGNPARFGELIAFKNAYFGRTRRSETAANHPTPALERHEFGVLTLRRIGRRVGLKWDGPGFVEPIQVQALRRIDINALRDSDPTRRERELLELQEEMSSILRELRTRMLFMRKSNRPEDLDQARTLMDVLEKMSAHYQDRLRALREELEEMADLNLDPDRTKVQIDVGGHHLHFSIGDRAASALDLRIFPETNDVEFTWVRPGVDFTALKTPAPTTHRLSPVRNEAQLLIDEPGEPTRVVRVVMG